jgi:hypothetical protein
VFVHGRPVQSSLMFASKTGAYTSVIPFGFTFYGRLLFLRTNIRLGRKGLRKTNTLAHSEHLLITVVERFIRLGLG